MLQRLTKSSHTTDNEESTSSRNSSHKLGPCVLDTPDPPSVGKVDHHSIQLYWDREYDTFNKGDKRLKFTLQEEDRKTKEYKTVYVGYADSYRVEGLDPLQKYTYCLQVSTSDGDVSVSPNVTVCTTKEPYTSVQLNKAVLKGNAELAAKILDSGEVSVDGCDKLGYTPLMNASQKGFLNLVELLLQYRADVAATNTSGKNSLMVACFNGHEAVVKMLREAGAVWTSTDRGGSTPLHWAIDSGNIGLIQWMIEDGAAVDIHDHASGWTPLMRCAAISANLEIAVLLINAGASINTVDNNGNTPLLIASLNGHPKLVEAFVERGADIHAPSKHGKTALEMARSFDRRSVVKYLEARVEEEREERRASRNSSNISNDHY